MMIGDRVFREITDNVWNPERRLEDMDRARSFDADPFDGAGDV